jgi:hypothetical protein
LAIFADPRFGISWRRSIIHRLTDVGRTMAAFGSSARRAESQDGLSFCETHHTRSADGMMGFAALYPSYEAICTTGGLCMQVMFELPVVPFCRSRLLFWFSESGLTLPPNQMHDPRVPHSIQRGASRSSRTLGAGCGGRIGSQRDFRADERFQCGREGVWSWPPDAEVKLRGDEPRDDGGNRARSPGRARYKR